MIRKKGRARRPGAQSPASVAVKTVAAREAAVLASEQAMVSRDDAAKLRDEVASLREEAATLREHALRAEEEAANLKAELGASSAALLRDANERLVVATITAQTMTETAEAITAQMSYMAEHDFLTGLPNRYLLTDRLAQSIALAQRHSKKVALLYLDIDNFKRINDSLGHEIGDQLLQLTAKRLQECIRQSDTVCRQAGDEFVVVLAEVDAVSDAALTAEKLIEAMNVPCLINNHQLRVTLSIGISLYPDDGQDVETVLRNADVAMYQAKRSGRNNYQVFTPEMNIRAIAWQSVEETLHQALEQHGFVLHYQPKVNLETGTITGAEALLRMTGLNQRIIAPAQFVAIAEECGLILPIGNWVLREACRQAQAWLQAGLTLGQISVNVSAAEFLSKAFLSGVRAVLDDTGLDPGHLEFELTESGLMQNTEMTKATLHALKDLGAHIAVDDFGTGYSSLSYLRRFPIDTLKIDQSFVRHLHGGTDETVIVGAIIAMGQSLKLGVVAEGIETRQQLDFLQAHNCTEGQGFYFSRPVAADEFATLMAAERL